MNPYDIRYLDGAVQEQRSLDVPHLKPRIRPGALVCGWTSILVLKLSNMSMSTIIEDSLIHFRSSIFFNLTGTALTFKSTCDVNQHWQVIHLSEDLTWKERTTLTASYKRSAGIGSPTNSFGNVANINTACKMLQFSCQMACRVCQGQTMLSSQTN